MTSVEAAVPFSFFDSLRNGGQLITLMHSERPKFYAILAFLSAVGFRKELALFRTDSSF